MFTTHTLAQSLNKKYGNNNDKIKQQQQHKQEQQPDRLSRTITRTIAAATSKISIETSLK